MQNTILSDHGPGADVDGRAAGVALAGVSTSLMGGVYERLRSDIVHGRLRPNERLVEAELAERLGVSRTPVREGLQRLAVDGLVVSRRRGWVVYEHTPNEVSKIYEARAALEGYASRLAAERASADQLAAITAILRDRQGTRWSPVEQLVEQNDRFHNAVIVAAGNDRLQVLIERNRLYYFNHSIAALHTAREAAASRAQHEQLLRALRKHDGRAAEEITRAHIDEALRIILARIR